MLNLGPLRLGERPCVAVAIQEAVPSSAIAAAGDDLLVELRLDALQTTAPDALRAFAERYAGFPLLATIRHADEGGTWPGDEPERLAAYRAVLPRVHAVDVEIGADSILDDVVAAAREHACLTIGSFHDFEATPTRERLEEIHERGRRHGVDIVKVAARCQRSEDLRRLAEFTLAHRHEHVIVVGMGPFGLASRVFFPALGSLVTYTFLGSPTAPGQLNCEDTLKYLGIFLPHTDV